MNLGKAKIRQWDPQQPTLFLDFDGVLHPDAVYCVRGEIVLRADGFSLFEWSPILVVLLDPFPTMQIVLSTSWVSVVGFDEARARLPESLQRRVIGSTWHEHAPRAWDRRTRYDQVAHSVERHRHTRWLAVDDDGVGWPEEHLPNLVLTDSLLGLGDTVAQEELREKLALLHR